MIVSFLSCKNLPKTYNCKQLARTDCQYDHRHSNYRNQDLINHFLFFIRNKVFSKSFVESLSFEPLNRNESGRFGALKSDSTHHFFRNACIKSGSLRFSQFSGC